MNDDRPMRIREVFHAALRVEPAQRSAVLRDLCRGDEQLCTEVRILLDASEQHSLTADQHTAYVPQKLSRYRILQKIGVGGMGEVFLAEDEILSRRVAVKVLPAEVSSDAGRTARFRREARAVAMLSHPNVVTIHDYGIDEGRHFFVTEYVAGSTLRDVMRKGCSRDEAIRICASIARALTAAHALSIVHRDIKPENVLITGEGVVKVVDFGVSKLLAAPSSPQQDQEATPTRSGMLVGTAAYMAPEQVRGEDIDARADVFSLGIVFYELLSGQRPFAGGTIQDTMAAILMSAPQPLPPSVADPPLAALIMSMLAKEKTARPEAAEVVRELDLLISRPVAASPPSAPDLGAVTPTNLPSEPSPLSGRDHDVGSIVRLLQRPEVRMVTLTGASGTGKTRVALRVARELLPRFPGGVWFVALDAVHVPALVVSSIAETLDISDTSSQTLDQILRKRLRNVSTLLVLDNFEQVIEAAPAIASLISGTESLKLLITSQAPLHLRVEHEYALDPLPVPALRLDLDTLAMNPAVMIFVDRARAVRADFSLTAENGEAVAEICRVLGGLPLALELAAVRVRMMAPAAILERLRDPLGFLTGGPRDLPERQRALRSAIEWSCSLLDEREKEFFAKLSVFQGGWSAEACANVCDEGGEELLAALIDKSLVRRIPAVGEERFAMLDAIRRVSESRLDANKRQALNDGHLSFFTRLAEAAEPHLIGAEQPAWMARLSADHANLRAALRHALDTGQTGPGLRLAAGMWRFWHARGLYTEGRGWLADLRAAGANASPHVRWRAAYAAGVLADAQGDYQAAFDAFEDQLTICRALDDAWATASAINNVAIVALRLGRLDEAAAHHEEAQRTWRELGNLRAAALSLQNLGNVERARHHADAARGHYQESAELFRSLGDERGAAMSLTCLADLDRDEKHFDAAITRYEQALQTFMKLNDHWSVAKCMADYGETCCVAGRHEEAWSLLAESALIFREAGDPKSGAEVLDQLAVVAAASGGAARALELAGAASALRRRLDVVNTMPPALEAALWSARARAGESADAAWQIGLQMTFDEAVDSVQTA